MWRHNSVADLLHRVSKKLCNFVLSELRQIFTNFGNYWHNGVQAPVPATGTKSRDTVWPLMLTSDIPFIWQTIGTRVEKWGLGG